MEDLLAQMPAAFVAFLLVALTLRSPVISFVNRVKKTYPWLADWGTWCVALVAGEVAVGGMTYVWHAYGEAVPPLGVVLIVGAIVGLGASGIFDRSG